MQLPTYIKQENQENYHELFNQVLVAGLGDLGWTVPQATSANITTFAQTMPLGTIWYNTDIHKLQVLVLTGAPPGTRTVQTITSA